MYKKEYKLCYNNEGVHLESAILVQIKIDAIEKYGTRMVKGYTVFFFFFFFLSFEMEFTMERKGVKLEPVRVPRYNRVCPDRITE